MEIRWSGHVGFVGGCTTSIDEARAVMAGMGTRWVYVRLAESPPEDMGNAATAVIGQKAEMRSELATVVHGLLLKPPGQPHPIGPKVRPLLVALVSLVAKSRSPIQRDQRHVIMVMHDARRRPGWSSSQGSSSRAAA